MKWGRSKTKPKNTRSSFKSDFCHLCCQACLTLSDPRGCGPHRLLCPWDSPGRNVGAGCHFLLQGIFPTQGPNPVSYIAGGFLNHCAIWEAHYCPRNYHYASKRLGNNTWYLIVTWWSVSDLFFKVILAIITLGKDVCCFVSLINFLFPKQSYSIAEANANPSPLPRFTSNPN